LSLNEGKYTIGIEAAISLILMAGVPVFIKFTAATPLTIGFFRLSVATLLFVVIVRPYRSTQTFTKKWIFPMVLLGVMFSIHWITYFLSIKLSTASIGFLGVSTYGVHLIFLGRVIKKTKPMYIDYLALLCTLLGTYIIIPELSFSSNYTIGIFLAVISGLCFASLPIIHQHYQFIPDKIRTFGQFFFAWLVFLFLFPWTSWELEIRDYWALLYLAIPGAFVTHTLWVRVTTRLSTTVTSLIFYLIIPLTMLISHFWLGEPMPFYKIAGAFFIVFGNVISMIGNIKRKNKSNLSTIKNSTEK